MATTTAPIRITSIGASTSRPIRIGFKKLSQPLIRMAHIRKSIAGVVSAKLKTHVAMGPKTRIDGSRILRTVAKIMVPKIAILLAASMAVLFKNPDAVRCCHFDLFHSSFIYDTYFQ